MSFRIAPTDRGQLLKGNDMLPTVMTVKSTLIAAIAAASIAVPAAPALAWGEKEQGFVAGVATAVIVDELLKNNRKARAYDRRYSAPVYAEPRTVYTQPKHTTSLYATPAARAFNSYSASERRAIQRNLRAWGYYHGGIDGAFGPGTYNAIQAYARDEGAAGNLRSTSGAFAVYDGLIF
ncbi:antifreeze protein [Tabrizicola piscis]|jgi:Putative peptidoglycan binding domain|uniref:Antifreeze protein n=2 Tax=Tabrizicola piscis TaxID=2494374 RepID=A0A3S8U8J2_9RHOB|nr:antifreeze protein [Tabrizicola piscis]